MEKPHKLVNGVKVYLTQAEIDQITAEWAANDIAAEKVKYIQLRRQAYGSIEDQLDFMAKNGVQALIDRNLAIKAQYPKPE